MLKVKSISGDELKQFFTDVSQRFYQCPVEKHIDIPIPLKVKEDEDKEQEKRKAQFNTKIEKLISYDSKAYILLVKGDDKLSYRFDVVITKTFEKPKEPYIENSIIYYENLLFTLLNLNTIIKLAEKDKIFIETFVILEKILKGKTKVYCERVVNNGIVEICVNYEMDPIPGQMDPEPYRLNDTNYINKITHMIKNKKKYYPVSFVIKYYENPPEM